MVSKHLALIYLFIEVAWKNIENKHQTLKVLIYGLAIVFSMTAGVESNISSNNFYVSSHL